VAPALLSVPPAACAVREGDVVDEHENPKGALLFILIYLAILAAFWINAYLRIWRS